MISWRRRAATELVDASRAVVDVISCWKSERQGDRAISPWRINPAFLVTIKCDVQKPASQSPSLALQEKIQTSGYGLVVNPASQASTVRAIRRTAMVTAVEGWPHGRGKRLAETFRWRRRSRGTTAVTRCEGREEVLTITSKTRRTAISRLLFVHLCHRRTPWGMITLLRLGRPTTTESGRLK